MIYNETFYTLDDVPTDVRDFEIANTFYEGVIPCGEDGHMIRVSLRPHHWERLHWLVNDMDNDIAEFTSNAFITWKKFPEYSYDQHFIWYLDELFEIWDDVRIECEALEAA